MVLKILAEIARLPVLMVWYAFGWRAEGQMPDLDKIVLIAAPHTSNWDYMIMFPLAAYFRRWPRVLIKDKVIQWPVIGPIIKHIGAIPIDRSRSQNVVHQVADHIKNSKRVVLVLAPEGTRRKTDHWKTGFYYMALEAGVPIVLGFLNYKRKRAGVGPALYPTGDIEADMEIIREFYSRMGYGKYPDQASDIRIPGHEVPTSQAGQAST